MGSSTGQLTDPTSAWSSPRSHSTTNKFVSTAWIMSFSCLSAIASPASFFRSKLMNSLEFNTGQADTNEANSSECNRILQYHLLPATVGPFIYRTMVFIYFYSFK